MWEYYSQILKRITPYFVGVFLFFTLIGCEKKPSHQSSIIRVGIIDWPGFYPIAIAHANKAFEKEGINVDLKIFPDNPTLNLALKNQEVDIAGGVFSDFIMMKDKGSALRVIAVTDYSNTSDLIIAHPSIKTPKDLIGKTISFEKQNSFSHLFISEFLELHHIPEVEIKCADIEAKNVLKALENNEIQAGHTWDPTAAEALKKGYRILGYAGETPGIITEVLAANDVFLNSSKAQIGPFLKVFFEAQTKLQDKEELKKIATSLNETPEQMESFIKSVIIADCAQNHQAMTATPDFRSLFYSGEKILNILNSRGQTSSSLAIGEIIDASFLPDPL